MDTKWKSMFETLDESVGQKKRWSLNRYFDYSGRITLAVILAVLAGLLLFLFFAQRYYWTVGGGGFGIPGNILLCVGGFFVGAGEPKRRGNGGGFV